MPQLLRFVANPVPRVTAGRLAWEAMEAMRESWTDERLDDFRSETARRSDAIERQIDGLRVEMNGRFEAMQRTTIQLWATSILTTVACFGTLLATGL
jgi:hypothetical protein